MMQHSKPCVFPSWTRTAFRPIDLGEKAFSEAAMDIGLRGKCNSGGGAYSFSDLYRLLDGITVTGGKSTNDFGRGRNRENCGSTAAGSKAAASRNACNSASHAATFAFTLALFAKHGKGHV